ncbi:MAG: hypothetical protein Q8O38_03510 [Sulfurimicrobium sp.]|nr:hypothetical protein [Sulfurimicrobium sp.]
MFLLSHYPRSLPKPRTLILYVNQIAHPFRKVRYDAAWPERHNNRHQHKPSQEQEHDIKRNRADQSAQICADADPDGYSYIANGRRLREWAFAGILFLRFGNTSEIPAKYPHFNGVGWCGMGDKKPRESMSVGVYGA